MKCLTLYPEAQGGARTTHTNQNKKKMAKQKPTQLYTIELEYNENESSFFDVRIDESCVNALALAMMIARGTLMSSMAKKVTIWNDEGFPVQSYIK